MIIKRKMTITHADFFRILPQALGSHDYSIENNRIRFISAGYVFDILLSEERDWKIGTLQLPVVDLEISLEGCSPSEALEIMTSFDRSFHKGGG